MTADYKKIRQHAVICCCMIKTSRPGPRSDI